MTNETPTFSLPSGFLGLERADPAAAICIAGIPFDVGTTNRSGARFGPQAVRQASRMLRDGAHPRTFADPLALSLADIGNFRIALGDIPATMSLIESQASELAHLVALGGDHGVTLPLLRALARRTGPLGLIHFDAHVDTWPENFGQVFAHGSVFYHALLSAEHERSWLVHLASRYSTASAAIASTPDGMVRPSAFAVMVQSGP